MFPMLSVSARMGAVVGIALLIQVGAYLLAFRVSGSVPRPLELAAVTIASALSAALLVAAIPRRTA